MEDMVVIWEGFSLAGLIIDMTGLGFGFCRRLYFFLSGALGSLLSDVLHLGFTSFLLSAQVAT